jgi:hypothetical protein
LNRDRPRSGHPRDSPCGQDAGLTRDKTRVLPRRRREVDPVAVRLARGHAREPIGSGRRSPERGSPTRTEINVRSENDHGPVERSCRTTSCSGSRPLSFDRDRLTRRASRPRSTFRAIACGRPDDWPARTGSSRISLSAERIDFRAICPAGPAGARQVRQVGASLQDAHPWSHRRLQDAATGNREGDDSRELREFASTISRLSRQLAA